MALRTAAKGDAPVTWARRSSNARFKPMHLAKFAGPFAKKPVPDGSIGCSQLRKVPLLFFALAVKHVHLVHLCIVASNGRVVPVHSYKLPSDTS